MEIFPVFLNIIFIVKPSTSMKSNHPRVMKSPDTETLVSLVVHRQFFRKEKASPNLEPRSRVRDALSAQKDSSFGGIHRCKSSV